MSEVKPKEKEILKLPLWNCEFSDEAVQASDLTVGDKFEINCSGKDTDLEQPLKIVFPEKANAYQLVVLNSESESGFSKKILVTGYKPGKHTANFELHGSKGNKVQVLEFSYNIKSVIEKGKQPQEFGPYGPFDLSFGWVFWAVIVASLLALFGLFFWGIRNFFLRKEQISNLSTHKTSLSPFNQF